MAMIFISHDLSVVRQIADRVAVMYLGCIAEIGPTDAVWAEPAHPYTEALVSAIPRADGLGSLPIDLPGDVPDPGSPPSGCRFHPRCPLAEDRCSTTVPLLSAVPPEYDRAAACLVRVPADS